MTGSIAMFSNELFSASLGASRYACLYADVVHNGFSRNSPAGSRQVALALQIPAAAYSARMFVVRALSVLLFLNVSIETVTNIQ